VLTAVNEDDWQIAADIKDGNISQFLLKRLIISPTGFACSASGRVIYLAVSAGAAGSVHFWDAKISSCRRTRPALGGFRFPWC